MIDLIHPTKSNKHLSEITLAVLKDEEECLDFIYESVCRILRQINFCPNKIHYFVGNKIMFSLLNKYLFLRRQILINNLKVDNSEIAHIIVANTIGKIGYLIVDDIYHNKKVDTLLAFDLATHCIKNMVSMYKDILIKLPKVLELTQFNAYPYSKRSRCSKIRSTKPMALSLASISLFSLHKQKKTKRSVFS